jgi:spore maturation protein A
MNYIFTFFIISASIFSFFTGKEGKIFKIISESTSDCALFTLKLALMTAFFSGVIKVAEDSGIMTKMSFFINKTVKKIFKTQNKSALDKITLNITSNILGIGNAATPTGLFAMKELDRDNNFDEKPSYNMLKFIMFNTCSVQLIPSTILGLRAMSGSQNPSAVILPVIITSFMNLAFGLFICRLLWRPR